jgi:hypothetical protein
MTFATVGTSAEAAAEPATDSGGQPAAGEAQQQETPPADAAESDDAARNDDAGADAPAVGAAPAAMLPTVAVDAIIAACAQSPDSRVVDIITAQGTTE